MKSELFVFTSHQMLTGERDEEPVAAVLIFRHAAPDIISRAVRLNAMTACGASRKCRALYLTLAYGS
jgi:hypothetical protein